MTERNTFSGTRGFTLVELLVVVAIIALLISILLPSLSRARDSARTVKCASNLKSFGTAEHMYKNDAEGYLLPLKLHHDDTGAQIGYQGWYYNPKFLSLIGTEYRSWAANIPVGMLCPDMAEANRGEQYGVDYRSYCMNTTDIPRTPDRDGWNAFHGVMEVDLKFPTEKIRFADSTWWTGSFGNANYNQYYDVNGEMGNHGIMYRHNGFNGTNFLHADSHVEYYTREEAWDEPNADADLQQRMWSLDGS